MSDNKLWNKGFETEKIIETFTVGDDRKLDLLLAKHDVTGSMAHIKMLNSIGLLEDDELKTLLESLERILEEIRKGNFTIEEGVEDVHSQVEILLTRELGDIGKKIHSGRSRNDQVLVDLKLFFREEIKSVAKSVKKLFDELITLSDKYSGVLMPGYTHFQVAMPSSFGLWFGAYAETLIDDMRLLTAAYDISNQNPLGSAAGYGSSFPLNREMTTELLEFGDLHYNVIAAQMSRGKTEKAVGAALAAIASTLGRLAMDICLYMCPNFGFISFPDEFTTGSSIMPHKKNPDVFEIIRGKCNRIQSIPNELALMTTNLPMGYHRDNQLLKDVIFPAFGSLTESLDVCTETLRHIKVNENILDDPRYDYMFTVEEVNNLTLGGMPFREAYKYVGAEVQNGTYKPNKKISHTHTGSIGNLANDRIIKKMDNILKQFGQEAE